MSAEVANAGPSALKLDKLDIADAGPTSSNAGAESSATAGEAIESPTDLSGTSPTEKKGHRRTSSSVTGVWNIAELEKEGKELEVAKETQKLNWKLNTSPSTVDDKEALKKFLTNPPVKKIDLHFPLGLEVTARNMKGVTIKDALDAIYKQYKKKADDELDNPILAGFEWDKEESWTRLIVHQKKEGAPTGKKKAKKGEE